MITIEKLREFGVNVDEGLGRCFGNEALYIRLVGTVPGSAEFDQLAMAINAGDLDKAFEAAHALKGVLGNLSLTPLYKDICEMTDDLRQRKNVDYKPYVDRILAGRDALKEMSQS